MNHSHPIIVIGAGPIGLATAAHLLERGQDVRVLEAGSGAGAAIRNWGHIRLFSTWRWNIDAAARRLLETPTAAYAGDWNAPRETRLPTGSEMVTQYLEPLAAHPALAAHISYGHRVAKVTRLRADGAGVDKTSSKNREDSLFLVRTETADETKDVLARAVIDASGTWGTPNPVGRSGIEAIGEAEAHAAGLITSPLPDPLGADAEPFSGKTILVMGAGHSAANTLISLGRLRQRHPDTRILWGLRGAANPIRMYGGGPADQLPARGQLGTSLRRLVEHGDIDIVENVAVTTLERGEKLGVVLADGRRLEVDLLVPATGFRPDLGMLSELRLDLDQAVEAPRQLGPLIDPEFHSCGTVSAHGASVLAHPETDFYIAGMKSYGRAPTFLLATGYEQVRSIAAALAGDRAAAETVELELPDTGVCSTDLAGSCDAPAAGTPDPVAGSCCGTPEPVEIGFATGTPDPVAGSCCGTPEPVEIGFATGTLHGHTELLVEQKS
ncbi:FAD-dependent oxidoreductase [Paeniglutamicibacter psychrophenolicus]|uniref:FAD-dependent oxidoreductase n=1 Tax=Paeniglutamicibacter psychrophenolicus TaxID=257454 RepID=UPI002788835F|nr:FAD-dependent oxidoreductase [Paeniglutamicibacter psychrophenolicus]MDQ0096038.1 glycine/D-amino acid oxidase-like deaminating enzyme [Paeniglutamicibacter psychrophenolicus]